MIMLNNTLFRYRRILQIATLFIMSTFVFCMVPVAVHALNTPSITAEVVAAKPNSDVQVKIILSGNPGIVSATVKVSFDSSVLSLTNVTDGGLLGVQSHKPEYTSPYTLAWVNDTAVRNFTSNGTITTLSFHVSNTASCGKTYPVRISYDYANYDIYDKDLNTLRFQTINGAVKITNNQSFVLGDADQDSRVTNADANCLQRFSAQKSMNGSFDMAAADVDLDGVVSIIDVSFIQRFLSNNSVPYPIGKKIE